MTSFRLQPGCTNGVSLQKDHFFDEFIVPTDLIINNTLYKPDKQLIQISLTENSGFCLLIQYKNSHPMRSDGTIASGYLHQFPNCCGIMVASLFNIAILNKEGEQWFLRLVEGICRNLGYTKAMYATVSSQTKIIKALQGANWKPDLEDPFVSRRTGREITVFTKNLDEVPYTYGLPKKKGEYQNEVSFLRYDIDSPRGKKEVTENWGIY